MGDERPLPEQKQLVHYGIRWTYVRRVSEGETANDLFGFPTSAPNANVAPIDPKAMPVILTGGGG